MKIGIDLDNTMNNLNEVWLQLYNNDFNDTIAIDDIHSWDIHNYIKIGEGIYDYLNEYLFYRLTPLNNSIEVTERLSDNHELFVITATNFKNMIPKSNWLKHYFPHIPIENVIPTSRKDIINVDLLIDDAPHNIIDFPGETIVMGYAWNRDLDSKYLRAKNWLEIEELINDMR